MDKETASNRDVHPGISVRMGPVEEMDVDGADGHTLHANGVANGKRKSRGSLTNGKSYKEASSSEEDEDKPLVRHPYRLPASKSL